MDISDCSRAVLERNVSISGRRTLTYEEFEALVREYNRQVLNVALRILGNAESANDVHQEVFLAIWRHRHRYNGTINWKAYLYQTTIRKAIDFAKRSKTYLLLKQRVENHTPKECPDSQLRVAELQKKLAEHLARLPERQANVFVLSRIEELENDKIAEILGCSPETVRVHLHRAMKRLAVELSDYWIK